MRRCQIAALALFTATLWHPSISTAQAPTVTRIEVHGNSRIPTSEIRAGISSRVGQSLEEEQVDRDIKTIYLTGHFDEVRAEIRREANGLVLIYVVIERPARFDRMPIGTAAP